MIDIDSYKEAFGAMPPGVNEAEVNAEETSRTTVYIKGGRISAGESEQRTRLYVRATEERTGTAYTENLDEAPNEVLKRAAGNSRFSSASAPERMNGASNINISCKYAAGSIEDATDFGIATERYALAVPSIESITSCTVAICSRKMRTINSQGLDVSYSSRWNECAVNVMMKRGGTASPGYAYINKSTFNEMDAQKLVAAAVSDGQLYDGGGLAPVIIKSGAYDAVLTGRVMRNILMTAWMELSGSVINTGGSVFSGAEGSPIGSGELNIINAPSHPMIGRTWSADSEGTVCRKTTLVENGKLITPLYTLSSADFAGKQSTGSAGRVDRMTGSTPVQLVTVPGIFYVEPGEHSIEKLVSRMDTGLLLTYSLDLFHSVNITSGDFSIPCGGVYYEHGRPLGAVTQTVMAGNIKELLHGIETVGDDLDFDDFYLRSYMIGSPSVFVRGLKFGL